MTIPAANRAWKPDVLEAAVVVERAKNGDLTAFAELYTLYKTPVHNLCLRLTRHAQDAEDLTQEVFLQVYRKVNSFRGESAFGSWLYRVATNVTMMHLRKRRVEEGRVDMLELMDHPVERARGRNHLHPVEHIALLRALCGLSKKRRNLIILHDLQGLTHNEVAQSLGVTTGTSKSRLYQAHRQLRETLGGHRHAYFTDGLPHVVLCGPPRCINGV